MVRRFNQLSRADVADIIHSYDAGETKAQIAVRHGVDHSTVIYHIRKHELSGEPTSVYAVIAARSRKPCIHPSSRCLVCQRPFDQIQREERIQIRELTAKLRDAQERLRAHGLPVE